MINMSRLLGSGRGLAFLAALVGGGLVLLAEEPLPDVERLSSSPLLRHLKPNPVEPPFETGGQRTVSQMYVPEGFKVEVVVEEPALHQPIAFTFDERGRIWVLEALSYPVKRPEGEGLDQILIFADADGDGSFESRTVFAQGLNLASALEVGHGGVWVGAAPELLFIPDRDGDDIPDGPPEVVLDGFGLQDTHECLNNFMWGPDGWLYGNQGVFNYSRIGRPGAPETERTELRAGVWRYHPVRREFEVFAYGGSNQWGLDYDGQGQMFMTHCRSYWGRGPVTHVIQGGHFWNQANANYAPFIIARPPAGHPEFRNYLLASARHSHGAGGAGERGSDAIYGGHSHVGAMFYYGDNWPDEYRGRLFTHNLGGHQINQEINQRAGSGYETVHASEDMLFCTDPRYVAIDLKYGPDGAVYMLDWYDRQHCHNPNTERWDRSNGRIYRLQYQATYRPRRVDLGGRADGELVDLLSHKNDWFARMARRLLHERGVERALDAGAVEELRRLAVEGQESRHRLNALWTLYLSGDWRDEDAMKALEGSEEFIRAWAIQLATDGDEVSGNILGRLRELARGESSPVVRRYLASAIQRVPAAAAWELIEALARYEEDQADPNLPLLIWHGLAQRMPDDIERAFRLARAASGSMPFLLDQVHYYAATLGQEGLELSVAALGEAPAPDLSKRLAGLWLALAPRGNQPMPAVWKEQAPGLYRHPDLAVVRKAEQLAAVFGDTIAFPRLRESLVDAGASMEERRHAFAVLSRAQDQDSLPLFLELLKEERFRSEAIQVLARFEDPRIPEALLNGMEEWAAADRSAALETLTSRAGNANALLDAVEKGKIRRQAMNSFHVRKLEGLGDKHLTRRVGEVWGSLQTAPADKAVRIAGMEKVFSEAPLWAYDARAGRELFGQLCAPCHKIGELGVSLGPDLTGAGKNGVGYYLENIIDPDAVIGSDYEMVLVETRDGGVLSGTVLSETESGLTLRTIQGEVFVSKGDIQKREKPGKSLMPEGLLEALEERQQLELLKFLIQN